MSDRRMIPIPGGPSAAPGVANMMPGASVARVRGAGPVQAGRVRLQSKAPNGLRRAEGVLVDGGALAAGETGKARASLAKGDAVVSVMGTLDRIAKARETSELLKADADWKQAFELYRAGLPEEPGDWLSGWKEKLDELKEAHIPEDKMIGPMLRRKLNKSFEAFSAETGVRLSSMAIERNAQIAKIKGLGAFDQYVEMGDIGSAGTALQAMVQRGVLTRAEADVRFQKADRGIKLLDFHSFIQRDPFEAEKVLEDPFQTPFLSEQDVMRARAMAREAKHRVMADEAQKLSDMAYDESSTTADFVSSLESSHLGNETKSRLMDQFVDKKPDFNVINSVRKSITDLPFNAPQSEVDSLSETIYSMPKKYQAQLFELLGKATDDVSSTEQYKTLFKHGTSILNAAVDEKFKYNPLVAPRTPEAEEARSYLIEELRQWLRWTPERYLSEPPEKAMEQMTTWLRDLGVEFKANTSIPAVRAPGIWFKSPAILNQTQQQQILKGNSIPTTQSKWKWSVKPSP